MKQKNTQKEQSAPVLDGNESVYINLLTDYGLKSVLKVQELAINFLNDVLGGTRNIQKITYLDKESIGKYKYQRTSVFDLLCEDDQNREFIVEIQRIKQQHFLDRSVYYASARIQENAPKGKEPFSRWDFMQKPLIFIGILDFDIEGSLPDKF
jgi:predicted transposase/invertase (TIGR01784 family)